MKKKELGFVGSVEQLAYVRSSVLSDGAGRGNRIIDVNTGGGLQFTIHPDRGMDIVECSFLGINMVYRSGGGTRSRLEYQPLGTEWLRSFQGGLLTGCGMRNAGVASGECGAHGRLSNTAAEDVSVSREWEGEQYVIRIRGVLREYRMFGEDLRLVRNITCIDQSNIITIEDEVENLAGQTDYLQMLYHCNFGYPLISPAVRLEAPEHTVEARDADAAAGIAVWNQMPAPVPGAVEQCFYHDFKDTAEMTLNNSELKIKATVRCDTAELPRMVQWKLFDHGNYVMGIEPTNTRISGRENEIAKKIARAIAPGEKIKFRMQIEFASTR